MRKKWPSFSSHVSSCCVVKTMHKKVQIFGFRKQALSATQRSSSAFNMPQFSQKPPSSVVIDVNSYFGKICNYKLNSSVVGLATYYLVIESQWGRVFPHPSQPALRPT